MRKEKKLNPVKKLAKKTALRTAYQAQAHAKQAGQEIRGGASGEGPSDNYAQQKVEDKAKEAAEDAAGFAFRSTKIPYKMYRRLLLKRQAAKASAGETSSSTPLQNTTVPTETQVTRKTRFRRKAIQQQAIKAKAPQRVQNLMPKENQPLPDRKQVLRKRVILIKAVRKKLAEREARRAATHSMPTPKLPRTSSKPVREQLQRLANYLLGKLKQLFLLILFSGLIVISMSLKVSWICSKLTIDFPFMGSNSMYCPNTVFDPMTAKWLPLYTTAGRFESSIFFCLLYLYAVHLKPNCCVACFNCVRFTPSLPMCTTCPTSTISTSNP